MRIFRFIIYLSFITLVSCGGSHYEVYQSIIVSDPWMVSDTLEFTISPKQIENRRIEIIIQHIDDFKYENIYIRCSNARLTDGKAGENTPKLMSIPLVNKQGKWKGSKNGKNYIVSHAIKDIELENKMEFQIIHQAREDALGGVSSVAMGVIQTD